MCKEVVSTLRQWWNLTIVEQISTLATHAGSVHGHVSGTNVVILQEWASLFLLRQSLPRYVHHHSLIENEWHTYNVAYRLFSPYGGLQDTLWTSMVIPWRVSGSVTLGWHLCPLRIMSSFWLRWTMIWCALEQFASEGDLTEDQPSCLRLWLWNVACSIQVRGEGLTHEWG